MLCKKCDEKVEPQYENGGLCENCSARVWAHMIDDYEDIEDPSATSSQKALALHVSALGLSTRTENCMGS